jgi:ketosteroid isomerase-like protein
MKKLVSYLIISVSLMGCTESGKTNDLSVAKDSIIAVNKKFALLLSKGDSVGLIENCYTKDAVFMNANSPSTIGRKALIAMASTLIKSGVTGVKNTTKEVWGDENTITEEGTFELSLTNGTLVDRGKYICLWKKEDGKWKVHRDCSNSDLPIANK